MRKLIVLTILMATLWAGYWFVGVIALESGLKGYLSSEHSPDSPVPISYSDLSVRGFPSRFDTTLTDITVNDTINGIGWSAPFFQIHALSYKPYHIIAALPHSQTLRLPREELQINSDEIKGSVVFVAGALLDKALEIDRSSFVMRNVTVTSNAGWKTAIKEGSVATRKTALDPLHYDLALSAKHVTLPDQLRTAIDPKHQQSDVFDSFSLDSTLAFTNPWNLLAERQNTPVLTEIAVNGLTIIWDDVQFQADGALQIDRNGYPNGKLALKATNWQKMYQLAEDANAVDADFAQTIQNGLKVLAGMSSDTDVIEAPLNFADGQMFLGPLPIGPAPRLN